MEYETPFLSLIGIIGAIVWILYDRGLLLKSSFPVSKRILGRYSKSSLKVILMIIGLIAWVLLSYSLTGPRQVKEVVPGRIKVNDIMFVVDISRSMTIRDLKPNRLEVAKDKIHEFISLRPTDRIGVIVFSEKVLTMLPLTTDNELVKEVVKDIRIIPTLGSGTNIGDSLALGVGRLQAMNTENKIVILLTDGVSNVDTIGPLEVAKMASDFGIKIYTIGIGVDKDAPLPMSGGISSRPTPGGAIDFKMLKEVSNLTGAESYKATSEESLAKVFNEIQKLEKTEIKSTNTVIYKEEYFQYMLWGILLLLLVEGIKMFYLKELI